jgi:pimeloyl-ACP methyl ester carboxylesterase
MLHGNGENLETMRQAGLFVDLAKNGAAVLAIDYPGYGRSAGTPSEAANLAAAEAAWEWMLRHRDGNPPVIAGWSLGAAVAAQLAAKRRDDAAGVILLSAWDRLDAVARLHFPGWMVSALLSERYDSAAAAANIAAPALLVHGDDDDIIPIELGRSLYAALPRAKQWVEVAGASHNDLLARPEAWQAIHAFLEARGERPGG